MTMRHLAAALPLACLGLLGLGAGLAGCDDAEAAAVEAAFYDQENAFNRGEGAMAADLYTTESLKIFDRLIEHALHSDEATVRALEAAEKLEVLTMRNRCDVETLEQLDGRGWVEYFVDRGWSQYEEDPERPQYFFEIGRIRVAPDGNYATAHTLIDGREVAEPLYFEKEDGRWKRDAATELRQLSDFVRQWSAEVDVPIDRLLLLWEAISWSGVRRDIWEPMKKRR
ncbi:MAG: hypothetical protein ACF8R7_04780 [Phycisphaerales bacterium JB039]